MVGKLKDDNLNLYKSEKQPPRSKKGRTNSHNKKTTMQTEVSRARKIGKCVRKTSGNLKIPKMETHRPKP